MQVWNAPVQVVMGVSHFTLTASVLHKLCWLTVGFWMQFKLLIVSHKALRSFLVTYRLPTLELFGKIFQGCFAPDPIGKAEEICRTLEDLSIPRFVRWNSILLEVHMALTLSSFRELLRPIRPGFLVGPGARWFGFRLAKVCSVLFCKGLLFSMT